MYNVTIIGSHSVGKSSLWMQWSGHQFCTSYCATIFVEKNDISPFTIYEIPTITRFVNNFDKYYDKTDIFVLIVNQDCGHLPLFEELSHKYREASWLLILNGSGKFPKCRSYANDMGMYMACVDLKDSKGVTESFETLKELSMLHKQRPEQLNLSDEVYSWLPSCY